MDNNGKKWFVKFLRDCGALLDDIEAGRLNDPAVRARNVAAFKQLRDWAQDELNKLQNA